MFSRGGVPIPEGHSLRKQTASLAGSNFATNWGSFGFFGPLTIRLDLWDHHIAQRLLVPTMDRFEKWGVREAGLFTLAHSPKHIGLYQKFGFWPRFLTAIMSKHANKHEASWTKYSALSEVDRAEVLTACRNLTDSIFEGLDVTSEIRSVQDQSLGETILLWGGSSMALPFAIAARERKPEKTHVMSNLRQYVRHPEQRAISTAY